MSTVILHKSFTDPFKNVVATARTCYSSGGIVDDQLLDLQEPAKRDSAERLARSIYRAGHHTTFQHAQFQFQLVNVSRQFIWSFLHSHPFYNSEQVSQRYVEVKAGNYVTPPLEGDARAAFEACCERQFAADRALVEAGLPEGGRRFYAVLRGRRGGAG